MDKYLVDIISRVNDETDQTVQSGYNSSDTISWKAFREAEKIDNASYIPELIGFIDSEKDKKKRDRTYFLLGHIAKNTNDDVKNSAKFAIESIKKRIEK